MWGKLLRLSLGLALVLSAACGFAQQGDSSSNPPAPESSQPADPPSARPNAPHLPDAPTPSGTPVKAVIPASKQQPKRILGVMPNYRAVSAGEIPPPPTPRQALKIATQNSFDYSSFVFVGITSALAEWTDAHPQLGQGMPGYGRYYWRGFLDKTDGNYLVVFALPTVLHQDERYYAKGEGGFWKRGIYAATRILITPNYQGHNTFNASEVFGRGAAQAISTTYYPSQTRTAGSVAVKYGWAMGRDAFANVFREFWPDISARLHHRHD
jgi:hypothetical protein